MHQYSCTSLYTHTLVHLHPHKLVHLYTCTLIHLYTYAFVHLYTYTSLYTHILVHLYTCPPPPYIYTPIYLYTYIPVHPYICTPIHLCTYKHLYTCIVVHSCTHIHLYTYTPGYLVNTGTPVRGVPRIWEGGGPRIFFFRFGNLHVAKQRGVRGHAPPRNFLKRCNLVRFRVYFDQILSLFFSKSTIFYIKNKYFRYTIAMGYFS